MSKPVLLFAFSGALIGLSPITAADSAKSDWIEGSPGESNGATRDYYNRAAVLSWTNFMGDWRDAQDVAQGNVAYATAQVDDEDRGRFIEWDVSILVRDWSSGQFPNQGIFLRSIDGNGNIAFASREHLDSALHPQLIIVGESGTTSLIPAADTYLSRSTYRGHGQAEELRVVGNDEQALLRFDLPLQQASGSMTKATLRIYTTKQFGDATIGVFRCRQGHDEPASEPVPGLAARYPDDNQIATDPDVLFATDFESPDWDDEWTQAAEREVIDTVASDLEHRFEPLLGKSLRVRIAEGANGALNTLFKFARETGKEPGEIYFRYYLRLGDDWNQTIEGGKLPGISGTYGIAGWGGRKSHGEDGWSARGLFRQTIPAGNPLGGTTPVGFYCYHADMEGNYGDHWVWQRDYRGYLENNRWYALEQYVKLNTPGKPDGILRAWVDGRLAFEKTDIRFRLVDDLKIEQVWMNVYHGGKRPSPHDQHVFIDNVVIARKYIGPLQTAVNDR